MEKKTYIPWSEYKALKGRREALRSGAIELTGTAARDRWDEIEEIDEQLDAMRPHIMPEVGMGCTEILWSDRRAKTIVQVITPNKIVVRENETKCLDWYGDRYEILPELSDMPEEVFTRRKSGRWCAYGQPDKFGSVYLAITYQEHSIDPGF